MEAAKWLVSLGGVDHHVLSDLPFRRACHAGDLPLAQWLYSLGGVDHHAYWDNAFRGACSHNQVAVAQWLYGLGGIDASRCLYRLFLSACGGTRLDLAQWVYTLEDPETLSVKKPSILRRGLYRACYNGRLEIVQWLVSLGVDYRSRDQYCFRVSVKHGHDQVARYIHSLGGVDHTVRDNESFLHACQRRDAGGELARWIYSLGGVDHHVGGEEAMIRACSTCSIELAKWIYSLGGVDLSAQNDRAYVEACNSIPFKKSNVDRTNVIVLVQWLCSVRRPSRGTVHQMLVQAYRNDLLRLTKWLYQLYPWDGQDLERIIKNATRFYQPPTRTVKWLARRDQMADVDIQELWKHVTATKRWIAPYLSALLPQLYQWDHSEPIEQLARDTLQQAVTEGDLELVKVLCLEMYVGDGQMYTELLDTLLHIGQDEWIGTPYPQIAAILIRIGAECPLDLDNQRALDIQEHLPSRCKSARGSRCETASGPEPEG